MSGRGVGRPRRGRPAREERNNEEEREHIPQQQPPAPPQRRIEELFLRQNPPTFNGTGKPEDAEHWVRAMERIFNFLHCTDRERLSCVVFQLSGAADFWWEARRRTLTPQQLEAYTWEEFKMVLYDKYIPKAYRVKKETEFYSLKQGKMSVTDYDRVFSELSRYAPHLVDIDEKMADKFRSGLRCEISMSLASHGRLSYADSLNRALDVEAAMPEERRAPVSTPFQAQIPTFSQILSCAQV